VSGNNKEQLKYKCNFSLSLKSYLCPFLIICIFIFIHQDPSCRHLFSLKDELLETLGDQRGPKNNMKTNHKVVCIASRAIYMHKLLHENISREVVGVTCANKTALHVELAPQVHLMHTKCNLGKHT
jgi:hypothetical protein